MKTKTTNIIKSNSNEKSIVDAIVEIATTSFTGTMTQLSERLTKMNVAIPKNPATLRITLNRLIYKVRNKSVSMRFRRAPNSQRTRLVTLISTKK